MGFADLVSHVQLYADRKRERHNTDEYMHLKKQIEEMLKARKLSHLIKELKQNNGKEQTKAAKKGKTSGKDKALAILMLKNVRRFQRFKQSMPETWLSATRNRPEVDKAFHKQIGRNLKVYVDELVIKSRTEDEMVRDIEETFKTLKEINMKLNPKKCTFGVEEGMFLVYKVNTKGLKVCPDKVDAVLSLPSSKYLKDVQKLNRKLASLNRALRDPEINYSSMEKFVLALVHVSKHLKRYFQAHPIIVITNQSIQQVLSRQKVAGRLQKWSIELGEYAIHYRPRVSVKGQILVSSCNA
nr:retrovirus-related Pol polyprotein from transposon opus [Tanacetum cinerariifolium]